MTHYEIYSGKKKLLEYFHNWHWGCN